MGIINKLSKSKKKTEEKVDPKTTKVDNKEKKVEDKKTKKVENKRNSTAHRILLRPVVSEKATALEMKNQYVFIVNKKSNKTEIKKAIKSLYGVDPISISVLNIEGKRKRFGLVSGKRNDYKKAIISLPKGKTIHIHEGV